MYVCVSMLMLNTRGRDFVFIESTAFSLRDPSGAGMDNFSQEAKELPTYVYKKVLQCTIAHAASYML